MRIENMLVPEAVILDLNVSRKEDAIARLVDALGHARSVDVETAVKDIMARERAAPTIYPVRALHIAIPHASTKGCNQLLMAIGVAREGLPWDSASDRRANVIFLLLGPPQTQMLYLRVLGRLARLCETDNVLEGLLRANSVQEVIEGLRCAERPLGEIVAVEGLPSFCVLGAGHGGMAMAAHLAISGCKVNLFNRSHTRLDPVRACGGIAVSGEVEGFAHLDLVTSDPAAAIDDRDVLMVVVPATAHRDIAGIIAPHVKDGQVIVLNPGRTGGALEVAQVLQRANPTVRPYIAEAQTLLYASRATNPAQVHIFGIKNSVPLAALPAYHIADILPIIRKALPQFVPGDNVLKTGLDNIGAVFHPAITVLNAGRIEDTCGEFEYYVQGVTPSVAAVLDAVDRERVNVAAALGIRAHTAREWLYLAYDAAGKTLFDAMRANRGYTEIKAPGTIDHRYISEDVPASLIPIASLGDMLKVPTPTIKSIIQMACTMHGVDYWKEGRTVDRLGIQGMSVKDIRFLVVGAESVSTGAERPSAPDKDPTRSADQSAHELALTPGG